MKEHNYLGALLTGQAPRSNQTVQVHRSLRDGYATPEEFRKALEIDQEAIIKTQENFAFTTGGQVGWLDILRPIALAFHGFGKRSSSGEDVVGPVTRWFRTNTFYRKPLVEGKITADNNALNSHLPDVDRGVAFFLGPYSFVKLVENHYYKDEGEMAVDYCTALAKTLPALKQKGYTCTLLLEPYIGYSLSRNSFEKPEWLLGQAIEKITGTRLGVHFPLIDATKIMPVIENTNVDFVGIDCTYTVNPAAINSNKDLLLGISDGCRISVETPNAMAKQAEEFIAKANFSGNYYIGPNDRLYDVPFQTALDKIKALSQLQLNQGAK
ncbi:MAG: hypothetical protein Q8R15_02115 [Candidatus Micrarchaeota archaeon]|nr:hypothetical protein [Candidatus Micrarchaeota archaeon]